MRGAMIFLVFFVLFTAASLLIPSPMFPGNVICSLLGGTVASYTSYLSALFNGILYSAVLWAVFVSISRRLEREK